LAFVSTADAARVVCASPSAIQAAESLGAAFVFAASAFTADTLGPLVVVVFALEELERPWR
jgi:hypothetical protein